jgi:hypothetical protein
MKLHTIVVGVVVALGSTTPAHAGLLGGGGNLGGSFAGGLTGTIDRPHGVQSAGTVAGDLQASRMATPAKGTSPAGTGKSPPVSAANTSAGGEGASRATRSAAVNGNAAQQVEGTVDSRHAAASTSGADALSLTRTAATTTPRPPATTAPSSSAAPTSKQPAPATAAPATASAPTAGATSRPPRNDLSASGSASTAASASVER